MSAKRRRPVVAPQGYRGRFNVALGGIVREHREHCDLSQREVATKLGFATEQQCRREAGAVEISACEMAQYEELFVLVPGHLIYCTRRALERAA